MKRLRRWWANPRIPISSVNRLRSAWIMLAASFVGWPVTAVLFAGEPPVVLALSWLALGITALDILLTSDVGAEVESA